MATIGRMVVEMSANTARFRRDLEESRTLSARAGRQIEASFRSVERSIGSVVAGMLSFRNILGIAIGTGVIGLAIRQATSFADALEEQSQRLGINVRSLQELQHAAQLSGASTEQFETGLRLLNQRLGQVAEGEKAATAFFATLGLQVTDTAGRLRTTEDVLGDLADTIAATASPAERTRIVMEAFGRSGTQLIPMLAQGRAGLAAAAAEAQRLGLVLDEHAIKQAARLQDEFDRLARTLQTDLVRAVLALQGPLEALTGWLAAASRGVQFFFSLFGPDAAIDFEALNTRLSQFRALLFDVTREREALIKRGLAETSQEVKVVDQQIASLQARIREIEAERAKRPPLIDPEAGLRPLVVESLSDFLARQRDEMKKLDDAMKSAAELMEAIVGSSRLIEAFKLDLKTELGEIDPNELVILAKAEPIFARLNEQLEAFRQLHAVGAIAASEQLAGGISALNEAVRAGVEAWDFFSEEGRERLIRLGDEIAELELRLAQLRIDETLVPALRELDQVRLAGIIRSTEAVEGELQAVTAAARAAASAFGPFAARTQELAARMRELREETVLDRLSDEFRRAENATALFGSAAEEVQRKIAALKTAIVALREQGLAPTEQLVEDLRGTLLELERLEAIKEVFQGLFGAVNDGIRSTVRGVLEGTQTMEDAFNRMARNIAISLIEHVILGGLTKVEAALIQLAAPALAGSSATGVISSLLAAGFGVPRTVPATGTSTMAPVAGFQHGGLVRRPTVAMIGEAGPEAVVPLDGGGFDGPLVEVNVVNEMPGAQATATESRGADGRRVIHVAIRRALGDMSASGELDGILRPFGAGRRGVSR